MKRLIFAALASICMTGAIAQKSIELGTQLPSDNVKMKDVSGKMVAIKDVKGKNGTLVVFSCNTCPYVVKNQDRQRAINAYAEEKGLGVIIINSNEKMRDGDDSFEAMQAYAKDQGYKWKYVVDTDSKVADAFRATRTPEIFLFDKEGKLVYKGAIDDSPSDASSVKREHLKEAINELVSGKAISLTETKSVGCTIKRKS